MGRLLRARKVSVSLMAAGAETFQHNRRSQGLYGAGYVVRYWKFRSAAFVQSSPLLYIKDGTTKSKGDLKATSFRGNYYAIRLPGTPGR